MNRSQFTVTIGTVMEDTKIPLSKWLFAMHLLGASKKGMSALQLSRMLGVTYKSAWFLCHRIREAMTPKMADLLISKGVISQQEMASLLRHLIENSPTHDENEKIVRMTLESLLARLKIRRQDKAVNDIPDPHSVEL
jgi:hypothetical protein